MKSVSDSSAPREGGVYQTKGGQSFWIAAIGTYHGQDGIGVVHHKSDRTEAIKNLEANIRRLRAGGFEDLRLDEQILEVAKREHVFQLELLSNRQPIDDVSVLQPIQWNMLASRASLIHQIEIPETEVFRVTGLWMGVYLTHLLSLKGDLHLVPAEGMQEIAKLIKRHLW